MLHIVEKEIEQCRWREKRKRRAAKCDCSECSVCESKEDGEIFFRRETYKREY